MNLADALVIKRENLFLVVARDATLAGGHGLWYRDCRFLSAHELRVEGEAPELLQASDATGTRAVHELRCGSLSVRVQWEMSETGGVTERILLRSHEAEPRRVALELRLGADFEPMLAVRGLAEPYERPAVETEFDGRVLRFSAQGRDGVLRSTLVEPSEAPAGFAGGVLRFELDLPAGAERSLELAITGSESGGGARTRRRPASERTRVSSDDELFDRVLARSFADLELLRSELAGQSYFAAGLPWFATLFGRDSLIAATQVLAYMPDVAEETLRLLGRLLGRRLDDERDEEPGKVVHELREGELAALGETPFARYYGSADSTPLWLVLLATHADWSGSLDLFRELRPQVDAALEWIERHGDLDCDGLVEYRRRSPHGLENQGWKDSPAGVPDAEGRPLAAPVALVEVQGYVTRALRGVAELFERDGDSARAGELRRRSAETAAALERFWCEEPGGYAIGLDAAKRPGSALTSNQAHLLWAGAVPPERASAVRDLLMSERMFSGRGVRTLAAAHPGFDPLGYHVGSVWPHDSAMAACGLRRYGFDGDFRRVFDSLLEAASRFGDYRLPELFGGYARTPGEGPVPYPVACRPQAWAAGSIPHLLWFGLGLRPRGLERRLEIVRPSLPGWVSRLELTGLRVAGARADLRFERSGDGVVLAEARVDGELDLVVEGGPG